MWILNRLEIALQRADLMFGSIAEDGSLGNGTMASSVRRAAAASACCVASAAASAVATCDQSKIHILFLRAYA